MKNIRDFIFEQKITVTFLNSYLFLYRNNNRLFLKIFNLNSNFWKLKITVFPVADIVENRNVLIQNNRKFKIL